MANGNDIKIIVKRPSVPNHVVLFVSLSIILLAFFILLNTFATFDDQRVKEAIDSIDSQFLGIFERTQQMFQVFEETANDTQIQAGPQGNPGDDLLFQMMRDQYDDLIRLGSYISDFGMGGRLGLHITERGLVITVPNDLTFDAGSSTLSVEGRAFLNRLATILQPFRNAIHIEGHTDNQVPDAGDRRSNWRLSQARAMSVLLYLRDQGVGIDRLSAAGAGPYRPVAGLGGGTVAAATLPEEQLRLNRRVEIIIKHPEYRGQPFDEELF